MRSACSVRTDHRAVPRPPALAPSGAARELVPRILKMTEPGKPQLIADGSNRLEPRLRGLRPQGVSP